MPLDSISAEFDHCIKCGLCLATCPVSKELLLEKYTPRGRVQLARFYSQGVLDLSDQYWDIFAKCLLCGACSVTCPSGVDLKQVLFGMREQLAKKRGFHPMMKRAMESLASNHNISESDNSERGDWVDFLDNIPSHGYQKEKADVVYFVGCVAAFFPMVQTIPESFAQILEFAKVNFTILADEEWCCGFPLIGAGLPEKLEELKANNIAKIKALGAKTVVFSCPSCYWTWKEHYDTDFELFHSVQFIEKLIVDEKIQLGEVSTAVTYHDPCDLGRNSGIFDAPRRILKSIPGLTFTELESNQAQSVCCGGGGNLEMTDPVLSGKIAQMKIAEIQQTGASIVVTSCQQCVRTMRRSARLQKVDLKVMDMTELVLHAISKD
ncbi:MAG: (Fe-S)-binding protein [Candidatus Heimdallarchaeota archaeon]